MRNRHSARRGAIAFAISTAFHVLVLVFLLSQPMPVYPPLESAAPPMDVQITPMEEPPPIPITVAPKPPVRREPAKSQPRASEPPPTPAPTPPAPQTPAPSPPLPAPPPKPAPPVAQPLPVAPRPEPKPAPAPPAKPAPQAAPAPPAPLHLNIHKPEKDAPNTVATLPLAPSPSTSAPAAAGSPPAASSATGGGEPGLGSSRLKGLSPYPSGAMPGGGSGLRGSLVGCANADAASLTSVERARCNERFGGSIGAAPSLDPISPAKRAAFDKAAERQARDQAYRDGASNREPAHPLSSGAGDTSRGPSSVIPTSPPH